MLDIGGGEIVFILIVVFLLFGPDKLPELAKMVGNGINKAKAARHEMSLQLKELQKEMQVDLDKDFEKSENLEQTNPTQNKVPLDQQLETIAKAKTDTMNAKDDIKTNLDLNKTDENTKGNTE